LRGNDGGAVSVAPDKFLKLKISSFLQGQKTKNRNLKFVIPAKAGIQPCRHGNLSGKKVSPVLSPGFPLSWE
ncbi:TPA: hypothetical protein ACFCBR_002115, partial [Neisseria gonorrhoeae]